MIWLSDRLPGQHGLDLTVSRSMARKTVSIRYLFWVFEELRNAIVVVILIRSSVHGACHGDGRRDALLSL